MSPLRFLLAVLLALVPITASAQPSFPKLEGRVVDAANLLSPEQEVRLTQLSAEVEQASSRQFVVATIPDLQGYDIADYGYQLGRAWGIGQKEASNGIVLIVAPNDRKVRIEVGYGLEPIMTDALSSQIVNDTIIPRFKAGDMPGGIMAGAQAIGEQMKLPLEAAEARALEASQKAAAQPRKGRSNGGNVPWGLIFWGAVLLFVVLPMIASRGGKRRGRRYRGGDGGALPIVLWTIANEMGRHSSGGSSSWGGGSDWGGGGGGGWGGGGGFSGGGGSFGGGGASGSW